MLEKHLRQQIQQLGVDCLAEKLSHFFTAAQLTYFAGLLGLLVLPLYYFGYVYLACAFLMLSGLCDMLDGSIARLTKTSSSWGNACDIVMDRVVEISVVFALFSINPQVRGVACLLMLASMLLCITSFLVVGIFSANDSHKSFHYSEGLMERAEAFLFFIFMMIWPSWFYQLSYLFSGLVLYTAFVRMKEFYIQVT